MQEMGEHERAIRDYLPKRIAHFINSAPNNSQWCFAGLFNGALSHGTVSPNGQLFIGKSECEWGPTGRDDWQATWNDLVRRGLLWYKIEPKANHPDFGGFSVYVYWGITELGEKVRRDDINYFNDLMAAQRKDEDERQRRAAAAKIG